MHACSYMHMYMYMYMHMHMFMHAASTRYLVAARANNISAKKARGFTHD